MTSCSDTSTFFQSLSCNLQHYPYQTAGVVAASGLGILTVVYLARRAIPPLAKKVSGYFHKTLPPYAPAPSNVLSFKQEFDSDRSDGIEILPPEIIAHVISFLGEGDPARLAQASRRCYALCRASVDPVNKNVYIHRSLKENLDKILEDALNPPVTSHNYLPLAEVLLHIDPTLGRAFCEYGALCFPGLSDTFERLTQAFNLPHPGLSSEFKELTQAINQCLGDREKIDDPKQKELRVRISTLPRKVILHLLFNLPDSYWRKDAARTRFIQFMVESTQGIDPGMIAAVRLRALWAISNDSQREDLLHFLHMRIEPKIASQEEGSSKVANSEA